jgi:K+-transporting ATPase ATPase C chain
MLRELKTAFVMLIALTVITGIVYPLVITAIAQLAFHDQANGSLIVENGVVRGSRLVGQSFDDPKWFWGRPSATGPVPYNASASSGSNLGPINPALTQAYAERAEKLRAGTLADTPLPIPVDLITSSGSGLDPHISPAAARFQVARVAQARGLDAQRVSALVEDHVEGRTLGFLGEPRVNVLELNLALDKLAR